MTNMAFGVRQVREFLAANGHVLTVRGYDYRTGSATVADLNNIRIKRTKVCEIKTSADLIGFLPLSGFATVGEWWLQIRRFCKGKMWLYRVEIDNDHITRMERDYEKREQNKIPPLAEEMEIHPLDERDAQRFVDQLSSMEATIAPRPGRTASVTGLYAQGGKKTTNWQEAAVEDAARRFQKIGFGKDDRDIWISMRDEAVARLPVGEQAPDGWIRINILGVLEVPKQPVIDAIMAMDDENFEFSMNGRYVIHIAYSDFNGVRITKAGKPEFVQSGNSFGPDIEHLMLSIDCDTFIDGDELYALGGGIPESSEFMDARTEAKECGEDPDDWVAEIMKVAEENIRASLRSIILFDDQYERMHNNDCMDAVLINYREVQEV